MVRRFVLTVLLALAPAAAAAHPHVFVDARAEVVFDADGRIAAVRNIWQFDEFFSEYAIQGLDADNDGTLSDAELEPLAKVNMDSLKDFDFFTFMTDSEAEKPFREPEEYWLEFHGGKLTLFYTLPLAEPLAVGDDTTLEVFDPEYFVAFTFMKEKPVSLDGAPAACKAIYNPPKELDANTAAILGAIPADQPDLPPDLQAMASGLANLIKIAC